VTATARDSSQWEGPEHSEYVNAATMDSTHWKGPQQSENMNAAAINNSSVLPHLLCHTQ